MSVTTSNNFQALGNKNTLITFRGTICVIELNNGVIKAITVLLLSTNIDISLH
jgi:hypothetical protein